MTEVTRSIAMIIGPLLLLRALSVFLFPEHFRSMMRDLEKEIGTVSFSMLPVFLFSAFLGAALFFRDLGSPAGIFIFALAVGGTMKASVILVAPHLIIEKVKMLEKLNFIRIVGAASLLAGSFFTYAGYFG